MRAHIWWSLAAWPLVSCSLGTFSPTPCDSNGACRAAFGYGSVCGAEGLCETAELHPRCEAVYPEDLALPVDPATTFLIGSIFDHALDTHVGRYRSAQLALVQANANGGLDGRQFAIVHCSNQEDGRFDDGLTKDEASVETALWLADTLGVPAIVGPAASSRTEAVYNAVSEAYGTLVVSPSATSPSLTPLDGLASTDEDPGLLWRTCPPDDLQSAAIAWDMTTSFDPNGADVYRPEPSLDVAVVYQTGAYGEGLELVFTQEMVARGGSTVGFPFSDATGRSDGIAQAANAGVDEVLFVSSDSADVIAFLEGAATLGGLADLPLFLTDAARNADVLDAVSASVPQILPHVRGTAPAVPAGPVYDSFKVSYAAEFGGDDVSTLSYTAHAFDAAWLVLYGHAWAVGLGREVTGVELARGLRQLSSGPSIDLRAANWNEVQARFTNGESIDVFGASGPLDDDAEGETSSAIDVWVVAPTGDFQTVESFVP